jgi:hypothetical protein
MRKRHTPKKRAHAAKKRKHTVKPRKHTTKRRKSAKRKKKTARKGKARSKRRGHAAYYGHIRKSFKRLHKVLKKHEPAFIRSVVG